MEIEINRAKETWRTKYYQGRHRPVLCCCCWWWWCFSKLHSKAHFCV